VTHGHTRVARLKHVSKPAKRFRGVSYLVSNPVPNPQRAEEISVLRKMLPSTIPNSTDPSFLQKMVAAS